MVMRIVRRVLPGILLYGIPGYLDIFSVILGQPVNRWWLLAFSFAYWTIVLAHYRQHQLLAPLLREHSDSLYPVQPSEDNNGNDQTAH